MAGRGVPRPRKGSARRLSSAEVAEVFRRFAARNPDPRGELHYDNPFTLLVAVVLSAQATDAGVNKATPALFAARGHAGKDGGARRGEDHRIHQDDRSLSRQGAQPRRPVAEARRGAWRQGAGRPRRRWRNFRAWGGRPPMSSSTSPSASRPSPSIPISSGWRTGPGSRRAAIHPRSSKELERVVPDQYKLHAHHWLILHGRYVCVARKPKCGECLISDICRYKDKTAAIALAASRPYSAAAFDRRPSRPTPPLLSPGS